jgi:hypothetical protein
MDDEQKQEDNLNQEDTTRTSGGESPTLSFKSGGWVILAAGLISLGLILWAISGVIFGDRPIGDGSNLESYGFTLEELEVPMGSLAASGNSRDFLQVYEDPNKILGKDLMTYNSENRRPWLVTRDRVVGVVINGEACAYPVRCLNAHEIIHDTLGGVSITVTYSPFADAPVVLENEEGEGRINHGVSGLLCNSALITYDRDEENPVLYSPLLGRSINSSGAPVRLKMIPDVTLCTWRDWLESHPDTTLVMAEENSNRRYKAFSYLRYFNDLSDSLKYPVLPLPGMSGNEIDLPRLKARVVEVTAGGERRIWPLTMLVEALEAEGFDEGTIQVSQGDVELEFIIRKLPQSAVVRALDGSPVRTEPRLFFASWAANPTTAGMELVRSLPDDARVSPRTAAKSFNGY